MADIIMNQTTANARSAKALPFLSADQVRPLLDAVGEAVKNYSEEDEERTGDAVLSAQDRIADARTVDPLAIAYKLRATRHWRDPAKGLAEDLKSSDQTARTIATIIRDVEAASGTSARRVPSRLRPLWEAYQKAWKGVSDAADAEDAAMLARPKDAPRKSTQAEKDAEEHLAEARKAFDAASDAMLAAPTRTVDDALCRIEHAIDLADENTDADLISSLNAALRVLRKVQPAQDCI